MEPLAVLRVGVEPTLSMPDRQSGVRILLCWNSECGCDSAQLRWSHISSYWIAGVVSGALATVRQHSTLAAEHHPQREILPQE